MSAVKFINDINADDFVNFTIIYKNDVTVDEEKIGEAIYGGDEFGTIDPPCSSAFFKYISEEMIEENFGVFSLKDIIEQLDLNLFVDDFKQKLSHIFLYNEDSGIYKELSKNAVQQFIQDNYKDYSLALFEIEIGG